VELYIEGCRKLAGFHSRAQHEALELFERASKADPDYPLPLVGIARTLIDLADQGTSAPNAVLPRVRAVLMRALDLDPGFAEAHSLWAELLIRQDWNWTEAEKHHELALRHAPDSAEVHDSYARTFLAPRGRFEEALRENEIARQLDPLSPQCERGQLLINMLGRRLRDVERESTRILERRREDGFAAVMLALALHGQRRKEEALAVYEGIFRADPTIKHETYVACARALCGEPRVAEELLERFQAMEPPPFIPAMSVAWLHLHLGRIEEGLTAVEQACLNRECEVIYAKVGFGFDNLRGHPRFRALIETFNCR
jgi:tetratricopeptide (TPR) repeat protein